MPYKNKSDFISWRRNRRQKRRVYFISLLGGKCVRCGSTDDLQFDHIHPCNKKREANSLVRDCSDFSALEELQKCQLLCKSCHLSKTKENADALLSRFGVCTCGECAGTSMRYAVLSPGVEAGRTTILSAESRSAAPFQFVGTLPG